VYYYSSTVKQNRNMIEINDLKFSYRRHEHLFDSLSLRAKEGSIIGLLGKNGAGKSTLLRLMAGLLWPKDGSVKIFDQNPKERKPSYLQQVFLVPEVFSIPSITIDAYLEATAPLYPTFDNSKMTRIINDFELDSTRNLSKMSYGQRKKFLIAFALSTNCRLLLFDEPTNGLDIPSKLLFRKVMAGALSDDQVVIISTHQVKDVENLIDRILLIDNGKIIFNHNVIDVIESVGFHTVTDTVGVESLYNETAPGGYRVITKKNGEETPLDIELLFNAVINGTKLEIHESDI